jgi:hypothetical protein
MVLKVITVAVNHLGGKEASRGTVGEVIAPHLPSPEGFVRFSFLWVAIDPAELSRTERKILKAGREEGCIRGGSINSGGEGGKLAKLEDNRLAVRVDVGGRQQ